MGEASPLSADEEVELGMTVFAAACRGAGWGALYRMAEGRPEVMEHACALAARPNPGWALPLTQDRVRTMLETASAVAAAPRCTLFN